MEPLLRCVQQLSAYTALRASAARHKLCRARDAEITETCAEPNVRARRPLSLAGLRPSPIALKFMLTSLTFGVASGMIVPYFNIYFMNVLNMGVLEIGLTSAAAGLFMVAGFIVIPFLTARIGKVRSAVATKLLTTPFLILMALSKDIVLAAGAYVVYMFLINMAGPATTSFQMEQIHPREQGFAVGLMSTGSCLAVSISSFVSGILIAGGNYLVPFLLTCAGYVATALLLYYYFRDTESAGLRRPIPAAAPAMTSVVTSLYKDTKLHEVHTKVHEG
jgi:Major Facilitator Superfamily.